MPDDHTPKGPKHGFATRMSHAGRPPVRSHGFLNPPVHRGSTVLAPSCAARRENAKERFNRVMTYGTQGGPTNWTLEDVVAEIEGGRRATIVGTGMAAVAVPLLAWLKTGDRCLMPDSVYGPARNLAEGLMTGFGIETVFYDPAIDAAGLEALWTPNTRVLYLESPGSHTFEVQDVPALTAVARAHGAISMIDNTWGIHSFQAFAHGCDVSIQALTKYVSGHSDILIGSVTVATEAHHVILRAAATAMGHYASPDDCWLALRGVRTMPLRLEAQFAASLEVAAWLRDRPEVAEVRHPGLPGAPGHEIWKRDFTGGASLFGIVFQPHYSEADIFRFIDELALFGIGASWGGYESLALPTNGMLTRRVTAPPPGQAVRLHIGLEAVPDLIADLDQSLSRLPSR
jgi:cystathionine beta-lyase